MHVPLALTGPLHDAARLRRPDQRLVTDSAGAARGLFCAALVAERDGHDYVASAFSGGATATLWSRDAGALQLPRRSRRAGGRRHVGGARRPGRFARGHAHRPGWSASPGRSGRRR
ncbi:MAG: hypothetical protein R2704_09620 [Microthrixaceae bacterium]